MAIAQSNRSPRSNYNIAICLLVSSTTGRIPKFQNAPKALSPPQHLAVSCSDCFEGHDVCRIGEIAHVRFLVLSQNGSKWCGNVWKNLSEKRRVQVEVGIDQAASSLLVQPYKRFQPSCRFPNCFGTFDVTRLCTGIQLSVETSKVALVRQACSDGILAVCDGVGYP